MNFEHMPELAGRYSYWIVIGLTIVLVAALYATLRRAKWL